MQKNNTTKIEAQGGEIITRNSYGDVAIIPKNLVKKYQAYMKAACDECIDELVASLPAMSQYAADGTVIPQGKKVKVTLPDGEQAEYSTDSVEYKNLYNSGKLANVVKDKVTGEDTYVMPALKEVEIVGKATGAARDMIDTKKSYTKEQYIKEKLPAFAGSLGVTADNLGGNAEGYKRAINTKVAENILKRKPNAKEKDLTPYELEIINNSDLDYKIRANLGERFEQGVLSVGNAGSPVKFKSPNLTGAQAERESTPLNMLAPLEVFPKTVRKLIGDDDRPNVLKDIALDPLNLLGLGLIDDLPKLGNIGKGLKNLVAERQFTKRNVIKEMSASDKLTDLRDGISALNYTENPDKIYRTINKTQLEDILETGKLRTPKEAGVKGKNNFRDTIYWYKGHAASRYGDIAIEAPNKAHKIEDLIFHIPDGNGNMVTKTFNELSKERQIAGKIEGVADNLGKYDWKIINEMFKKSKIIEEKDYKNIFLPADNAEKQFRINKKVENILEDKLIAEGKKPVRKSLYETSSKSFLNSADRELYKLIEATRTNSVLSPAEKQLRMTRYRALTQEGRTRLANNYPESAFENINTMPVEKSPVVHAQYNNNENRIVLNPEIRAENSTTRHEIEHGLQYFYPEIPGAETGIDASISKLKLRNKHQLTIETPITSRIRRLLSNDRSFEEAMTRISKDIPNDMNRNKLAAANYFTNHNREPSAFLGELQAYAIEHKYITHEYQKMTPKIVEQMVKEANLDPQKALRILGIGEENADNYKLIADNFNKLLGIGGTAIIGGSTLKAQLNNSKSKRKQ